MLLLHNNRPVHRDDLIRGVWHEPPRSASNVVQNYISRLRRVLDPRHPARSARGLLVSAHGGYALRSSTDSIDVAAFDQLLGRARRMRERGEPAGAVAALSEALALWRGAAFAGIRGPYVEAERDRLAELRLATVETRLEIELSLGHHAELVAEVTHLAAEHPLRERMQELLMLTLYGSGRQAEALAAFDIVRRRLIDELGVDPGPGLEETHRRVLSRDPDLPMAARETTTLVPPGRRPAQLPADIGDFTGRSGECARIVDQLGLERDGRDGYAGIKLVGVTGTGGVGKTALAVHAAHQVRRHYPDGQVFVQLGGTTDRPTPPHEILGRLLLDLGAGASDVPSDPLHRIAGYRSRIAGRRMLLVLDDARDAGQIRPLLPGTAGCAIVVTSRSSLADLDGMRCVPVPTMSDADAAELIRRVVGRDRVAAEPEAVAEIVRWCAGLPLALRIAAARLAGRPGWRITTLADLLRDETRRLDELSVGDLAVRDCIRRSLAVLGARTVRPEVDLEWVFWLVGSLDAAPVGPKVVAALADVPCAVIRPALEALVDAHLLESVAPERYRMNDLVRLFARSESGHVDECPRRACAVMANTRIRASALASVSSAGSSPP